MNRRVIQITFKGIPLGEIELHENDTLVPLQLYDLSTGKSILIYIENKPAVIVKLEKDSA